MNWYVTEERRSPTGEFRWAVVKPDDTRWRWPFLESVHSWHGCESDALEQCRSLNRELSTPREETASAEREQLEDMLADPA